jgi:hypothetical protein
MWKEWDADMMMMRPVGACAACGGGGRPFWDILINSFLLKIEMKCELWMILYENATKTMH